ncbi:MAG: phosphotransferase, partial [Planctomycetota bacterium]
MMMSERPNQPSPDHQHEESDTPRSASRTPGDTEAFAADQSPPGSGGHDHASGIPLPGVGREFHLRRTDVSISPGPAEVGGDPTLIETLHEALSGFELAIVLSYYDLGIVRSIVPFHRGSERTPKLLLRTEVGDFLLKCRAGIDADTARVGFSHRVHRHLANRDYPVAQLIETRRRGRFAVPRSGCVYELTGFVRGEPFSRSASTCAAAGRLLARFHRELLDLRTS